jgi:hypothetical protein
MLLYALTILVSAFLLFQVQPVIAKIILPWFGGSAAVWTVCLLFFQIALLGGYFYAFALVRYLKPRMQGLVHAALLVISIAALPIYPSDYWKPVSSANPTWGIVSLLAAKIGVPYFLLSTTGPLLQAWYARKFKGSMPYRLYALSNAGSMFALLSYPFLFEPVFTTHQQASMWSFGFIGFIALCGGTALLSRPAKMGMEPEAALGDEKAPRPPARHYWMWLALPAVASLLLLAVTNHLSQNVAAIPFLWVLPLSIYLLTFILCFEGNWYWRNPYIQLLALAMGCMAYTLGPEMMENPRIIALIPVFCIGLFFCCMSCHGELARLKPHPKYLTQFYVMISAGGALGGLFVGLLAPHVFRAYYELPLGLVACAFVILIALKQDSTLEWFQGWLQPAPILATFAAVALAVFVGMQIYNSGKGARLQVRNFYGALKVNDTGVPSDLEAMRQLTHGTISHGAQFLNPTRRDWPTTYYGPNTGVGTAIREKQKNGAVRIGVVGLGAGTIAAYGRWGDYIRYYEINPLVPWIARTQFTFIGDCRGKLEIAMGDARLTLEKEAPENFDVLAIDAFSSDSIPVHLLTREAMQLFFHHLKPDGILAVHISNRYLDLEPVVEGEAKALGKTAREMDTDDDEATGVDAATWILLVAPPAQFSPSMVAASTPLHSTKTVRLWTDDYSNLFQILKTR